MQMDVGTVVAVSLSSEKGMRKSNVDSGALVENWGLEGDAHAGDWHRQVSLLATESIDKMRAKGLDVGPGDFAENIATVGIDLPKCQIGDHLIIGDAELEVTQIGKECHSRCAIFEQAGDCVMPREGIFARVIRGGTVGPGTPIGLADQASEVETAGGEQVSGSPSE
jgi:molybdopterin adenylyltransferase